jgi:hypothetical protein
MEKLRKHKFNSLNSGKAENIEDFFNKLIKPQFEHVNEIKKTHEALLKYIEHPETTLFLRLYGSFSKDNYDLLRRGFLTKFPDRTKMVFCDNTFSMLFTGLKLSGQTIDENELIDFFNQEKLICSFGLTSKEKELSFYTNNKAIRVPLNSKGYYLAHIKPTGYGYSDLCNRNLRDFFPNPDRNEWDKDSKIRNAENNLNETQKSLLKAHFVRLVHPLNSFLVPKRDHLIYTGKNIGEELELIKYVKSYLEKEFPKEYKEFENITLAHTFQPANTILESIEWFDTPISKSKILKKKNVKTEILNVPVTNEILNEEEKLETNLLRWLKSIGMQVFTEILCPSILANPKVTIHEICEKHPQFQKFSESSKKSRLSSSKSIYKNGLIPESLQFIIDSKNTNETTRKKASELLMNF